LEAVAPHHLPTFVEDAKAQVGRPGSEYSGDKKRNGAKGAGRS